MELADGVAECRGDAAVYLIDDRGQHHKTTLRQVLDIPSYPQDIFSVRAATSSRVTVTFKQGKDNFTSMNAADYITYKQ